MGNRTASDGEESSGDTIVPRFEPIPKNLFPREYEELINKGRERIKTLKGNPDNVTVSDELTEAAARDYRDLVEEAALRPEKAREIMAQAAGIKARPENFRTILKQAVEVEIKTWRERVCQLEAALAGVRQEQELGELA